MNKTILIIDFDSTLVSVESLDLLAEIVLRNNPDKDLIVTEIKDITNLGMEGKIDFGESLKRRIDLFKPNKEDIKQLCSLLMDKLTDSVKGNRSFFSKNYESIYVISGGFEEFIIPVVAELGIQDGHVLANKFVWQGELCKGVDTTRVLAHKGGKVESIKSMSLNSKNIIVVGDGYTDLEIKQNGEAAVFIAFTENISRDSVVSQADYVAADFDRVIDIYNQTLS